MRRFWRFLKSIRPKALRAAALESHEMFVANNQMRTALQVIAGHYACGDAYCVLHKLSSVTGETESLCPWCVATAALSGQLSILRLPVAPELKVSEMVGVVPLSEPAFSSVIQLGRRPVQ